MEVLACLNGEIMPIEQARVPVWDRGFLFGDSVYEVCRIYRGRCWLEAEHFARLRRSLRELEFPPSTLMGCSIGSTARSWRAGFSRGPCTSRSPEASRRGRTRFPIRPCHPPRSSSSGPMTTGRRPALREIGVKVITHPDLRWKRCDIKTTNLLANCVATEAARRAGCHEAILVDSEGVVTEATHTSLLWVRRGRLEGTPEGPEILPGTTRQLVLRLVKSLDITFSEARISLDDLLAAEEVDPRRAPRARSCRSSRSTTRRSPGDSPARWPRGCGRRIGSRWSGFFPDSLTRKC